MAYVLVLSKTNVTPSDWTAFLESVQSPETQDDPSHNLYVLVTKAPAAEQDLSIPTNSLDDTAASDLTDSTDADLRALVTDLVDRNPNKLFPQFFIVLDKQSFADKVAAFHQSQPRWEDAQGRVLEGGPTGHDDAVEKTLWRRHRIGFDSLQATWRTLESKGFVPDDNLEEEVVVD